jgi:hypothetical protein
MNKKSLAVAATAACALAAVLGQQTHANAAVAARSAPAAPAQNTPPPAGATGSADTTTTFSVSAGGLAITAPTSVDLGSGYPGATITHALGNVEVFDNRALLTATWTASVSSTAFSTGASAAEIIPASDVTYTPGTVTPTGTVTVTVPTLTTIPLPLGTATAVETATGVGDDTATWNPTLAVHVPDAAVVGVYTGTITHSVT